MTPTNERTLRRFLKAPPVKWAAMAAKLDRTALHDIASQIEDDAQRMILLSAYLGDLTYSGTKHEGAQRHARDKLTKVRKAMGFNYPEQGLPEVSW